MSFEQALIHLGLQVCWRMISPQLSGCIAIAGFVLGGVFAFNLIFRFMGWQGGMVVPAWQGAAAGLASRNEAERVEQEASNSEYYTIKHNTMLGPGNRGVSGARDSGSQNAGIADYLRSRLE